MTIAMRLKSMYLSSNGATANVVHHDLELDFQGNDFLIVNISTYQQMSQTAIDSRKIPTDLQFGVWGTIEVYLFPKMSLPFPTFPGGLENTYSQFSRKLFD